MQGADGHLGTEAGPAGAGWDAGDATGRRSLGPAANNSRQRLYLSAGPMRRTFRLCSALLLLGCHWLMILAPAAAQKTAFAVSYPCPSGQYFDPAGLECRACNTGESPAASGIACACPTGSVYVPAGLTAGLTAATADTFATCSSCATLGLAVAADGITCMACASTASTFASGITVVNGTSSSSSSSITYLPSVLSVSTGDCTCPTGAALVEKDPSGARLTSGKLCAVCPSGTYPGSSGGCTECPLVPGTGTGGIARILMVYSTSVGTCVCPAATTLPAGVTCSAADALVSAQLGVTVDAAALTMTYYDVTGSGTTLTVANSAPLASLLLPAAVACLSTGDRTSCNAVANLCVLQQYASDAASCKIYAALVARRSGGASPTGATYSASRQYHVGTVNPTLGWPDTLPWLFYTPLPASTYSDRGDVTLTLAPGIPVSLVLAQYSLNGTWMGLRTVGGADLQLCGNLLTDAASWLMPDTNYATACSLTSAQLLPLLGTPAPTFYELYLQDSTSVLYPIPVINANYRLSGATVNAAAEGTATNLGGTTQLTRRFFMSEGATGLTAGAASSASPAAVQWVDRLTLVFRLSATSHGQLLVPVLSVHYAARVPGNALTTTSSLLGVTYATTSGSTVAFKVTYTVDNTGFWTVFTGLLIASLVLAFIVTLFKLFVYMRRRRSEAVDGPLVYRFVMDACNAVAAALFSLCFVTTLYWVVFFKLQGSVYALVPADSDKQALLVPVLVIVAVVLQAAYMTDFLLAQTSVDVFFIDWERPRAAVAPGGAPESAPVSVWRLLFVANEWNELQGARLTSVPFTLLLLVLILTGLGVENLSTVSPAASDLVLHNYSSVSRILRFGVAAFIYLCLSGAQVLWKYVLYHRYWRYVLTQFVDFLALSNISVFVMTDRYSGFYLHGRSLMPYTDVSLAELTAEMRKEQDGSVGARGLVPGGIRPELADNQCFEMFVTADLRGAYEAALLQHVEAARLKARERDGLRAGVAAPELASDAMIKGTEEVGAILRHFVHQVESAPGTLVLEKTWQDTLLGVPPNMAVLPGPVLYHDLAYEWRKLTLLGNEHVLLLFNVLVFTAVDLAILHSPSAAFITFLLDGVIGLLRAHFGAVNLERKALVDGRFLL